MRVGILPTSLVTLNFRVSHATSGRVMFSTFEATPMTLQMGSGDLMPALETRLLGLSDGARETLQFAAGEAFGPYSEALVERVERRHIPATLQLEQDTVYSSSAPEVLVSAVVARLKELGVANVRTLEGASENVTFPIPRELQADA